MFSKCNQGVYRKGDPILVSGVRMSNWGYDRDSFQEFDTKHRC